MLNPHDQERLEKVYPDGVPEYVEKLMDRVQRRRHSNDLGTGPAEADLLLLVTFIAELQQEVDELKAIINERAVLKKAAQPEATAQEPEQSEPVSDRPEMPDLPRRGDGSINWNRVKPETRVMCRTDRGDMLGRFHVALNGVLKGKLKIKLDNSEAEADTFDEKDVEVIPE